MGWRSKGYEVGGNVGGLLDSLAGLPALIVGSAETVWDDYAKALKAYPKAQVFAVNDMIPLMAVVHHAVSLHSDKLVHWSGVRHCDFPTHPWKTHSRNTEDGKIDYLWEMDSRFGLSGYFAMQIAYLMGCKPIVLVGCPGDMTRRIVEPVAKNYDYQSQGVREHLLHDMKRLPDFKACVRSMSGWSREVFGGLDERMESNTGGNGGRVTAMAQ